MGIIIAILLFSFIIIFHELGHFLLAKANGIRVEEFSLGLGPTLIGKQIGETKFSIKLLPFGGACMMGEDDADDMSEGSFNSKSVWARMSVIAAGPVFNLILAWIMCVIIILAVGYQPAEISGVSEGYSAEEQGMQAGDVIKEINGRNVHIWNDISLYTLTHPDETSLEIVYERDGQEYNVVIEPRQLEGDQSPKLGVLSPGYVRTGILGAMEYGAYTVKYWVNYTVDSLRMLFTGKVGIRDLSGPVGIVDAVDSVYQASAPAGVTAVILNMMNFGVLVTANLGILNLLPIPALDGGRLVFLIVEAVRRKRIPPEKEGMVHFAGFALLMVLMIVVMYNDILKLF
ncbi:MAG TPA: RIP metalloprotease RseP [Candidatus Mediterraneibacter stercoravium]|uniref:Zinc metalloprotease n=1 Tax=Candidatus Mediterraneibacter stercoravium TaxID=2838685 RepID=A0A9D2G8S0_9FIRM|nr:RIP metalloprotease RseP [Candidatus Mediterraneibacter stercoravium]